MSTRTEVLSAMGAPATAAWDDRITGFGIAAGGVYFPFDVGGHAIPDADGHALAWTADWALAPVEGTPVAGQPLAFLPPPEPPAPVTAPVVAPPPTVTAVEGASIAPPAVVAPVAPAPAPNGPTVVIAPHPSGGWFVKEWHAAGTVAETTWTTLEDAFHYVETHWFRIHRA